MMREVPYGEAISTKYPEWIVMINTVGADGRPDTMPAGWCMIALGLSYLTLRRRA